MVEVGVRVSGQLNKLHAKLGDVVSEGDLLAEIDDLIQITHVASAKASLESLEARTSLLQADLELAEGNLQRQNRLMEAQATTEIEYDRAVVQLAGAEVALATHLLQIEQARAALDEANTLLNFTRIWAPADGTIVSVLAEEGQMLNAGQVTPVLLKIGDLRKIKIIAKIAEVDVARLTPGMEAYLTTLGGGTRRWNAQLTEISPLPSSGASGSTAYFDALLEVDNADSSLLPGITTQVFFVTAVARNVLKIPLGALTFSDDTANLFRSGVDGNGQASAGRSRAARIATVRVVLRDGDIEERQVHIGVSNAIEAEAMSGLKEGERVLAEPRARTNPE